MTDRPRVALAGCGRHGRFHLDMLRALSDRVELVGICETDRRRLADAAAVAGSGVLATRNIAPILRDAKPDFVVVALMSHTSPEMCERILDAGVPVLSEVPPAYATPLAARMIERARSRELTLAAFENYVCTPIERLKQRAIAAGIFGEIETTELGGSVGHKGHEIAIARSYIGFDREPVRVRAHAYGSLPSRNLEGIEIPAVLSGDVEFDSGARARFVLSGWGRVGPARPIAGAMRDFRGSRGGFRDGHFYLGPANDPRRQTRLELRSETREVEGEPVLQALTLASDPVVHWRNPFADRVLPWAEQLPSFAHVDDSLRGWEIAGAELILDMADAVRTGSTPAYPVERSMLDVRIRTAMLESARRDGDWLPWQVEPFDLEREIGAFSWYRFLKRFDFRAPPPIERS